MNTLRLKTWRDLWLFKARTLLVVLAIAVGTAAVGVCVTSLIVMRRDLRDGYRLTNPAHAILDTTPFDLALVDRLADLPELDEAQARRVVSTQLISDGEKRPLVLWTIPDFSEVTVGRITPQKGALIPPPPGTVLLERSAGAALSIAQGDTLTARMSDGDEFDLQTAGFVHDLAVAPTTVQPVVFGYISDDTAARLGLPEAYNQLQLTVSEAAPDRAAVERAVTAATAWLEDEGVVVQRVQIPEPGVHEMQGNVNTGLLMIGILGGLTVVLSAFLVTNVMTAVIAQQVPQIGVMKAMGGRRGLVLRQYGRMVAVFGVLALLVAVPLGLVGAYFMSSTVAGQLNFDIPSFGLTGSALLIQVVGALVVPALAALGPLWAASRLSIRETLSGDRGTTRYNQPSRRSEGWPRPTLLAVRNAGRRRIRLALTVAALALAGAMFMATFGLRLGLYEAIEVLVGEFPMNVRIDLVEPQPVRQLVRLAEEVGLPEAGMPENTPVSIRVEAWGMADARRVYADGRLGTSFTLFGVPPTARISPIAERTGLWLFDAPAAVDGSTGGRAVSRLYINYEAEKLAGQPKTGDDLTLWLNGELERETRLVGISLRPFVAMAYMPFDEFEQATGQRGRAGRLVVYLETPPGSPRMAADDLQVLEDEVAGALTDRLEAAGIAIARTDTSGSFRASYRAQFDTLITLLMALAGLTALVGGMGLGNTMALNVLERSREIGILRSLGARRPMLRRLILTEGLLIALISALPAVILAIPLTAALDRVMGNALLGSPLRFVFSPWAAAAWVGLVVAIAVIACWFPAERAAKMTVREALAYE